MRNTLAFLAAAVIAVGAVGYYLDWFSLRGTPSGNGHKKYVLDVNTEKIGEDVRKASEDVKHKVEEKAEKSKKEHKSSEAPRMPGADALTSSGR
jgi:hypothetical protein